MISLRFGAVLLLPALGFGCFLDETPTRDGLTASATMSERDAQSSSSSFMPREPGMSSARSQSVDAGQQDGGSGGKDASASVVAMDAGAHSSASTPDGGTPMDAHVRDAQPGNAPTSGMDASAQAPRDAGGHDARPPTAAADAGASKPTQPDPIKPIHRYDFSGNGRIAVDRIAGKDATLMGAAYLDTRGAVQLGQADDDVVELPDRILAGLSGFTLLGWMELRSEDCWRRLFDFIYYREGASGQGPGQGQPGQGPPGQGPPGQGQGRGNPNAQASALYLTPYACPDNVVRLGYVTERAQLAVDGKDDLSAPRQVLLGAAYDSSTGKLQLIVDGVIAAQDDAMISLRELSLAAGRLGSPTNAEERQLYGKITEFRIYDRALDANTLAEIARRGPDQL